MSEAKPQLPRGGSATPRPADRGRPYTPTAVKPAAKADAAPETCEGCKHWREHGEVRTSRPGEDLMAKVGLCVVEPPKFQVGVTPYGPLCCYPTTEVTTPACGKAEPK